MKTIILFTALILVSCKGNENNPDFSMIWSYEYTGDVDGLSLAIVAPKLLKENRILIAPDKQITIIDQKNGKEVRKIFLENDPYIAVNEFLTESNDLFLKENTNENIYRIDLITGEKKWTIQAPEDLHQWPNDALDENWLYISSRYQKIFRYSKDGQLNKTYDLVPSFGVLSSARSIRILGDQLIFSQRYRGDECPTNVCGRILSIDKETEEVLWEYRTDNGGFIFEPILLEQEIIYAGVTDGPGEFVALNANNGEIIWKTLDVIGQSYTLTDSMVLVNGGVRLYALDKFTGDELWNTGLEFGGGHGEDNIGYLNGYVYHAHSGRLWIMDGQTGEIVHTEERSPDGSPFQLLAVGDDKVFIQTFNALYAYTAWEK